MKNIHLIPTEDNSKILLCIKSFCFNEGSEFEEKDTKGNLTIGLGKYANRKYYQPQYIYITSDEMINKGDWFIDITLNNYGKLYQSIGFSSSKGYENWIKSSTGVIKELGTQCKKIILTTEPNLIKNEVQAIDDEFLEWFVKNSSIESVEVIYTNCTNCVKIQGQELSPDCCHNYQYKIIIPTEDLKQEFCDNCNNDICCCTIRKQEALEEAAEKYADVHMEKFDLVSNDKLPYFHNDRNKIEEAFEEGAKWQQERSCSEEEVLTILYKHTEDLLAGKKVTLKEWFEQLKRNK